MLAHEHAQPRTGRAARLLGQLPELAIEADDIVPAHHPLLLVAEDLGEIHGAEGHEGRDRLGGRVRA